ncbi:SAM-dependent methyltransferases [Cronobacter condimenti 1330]|uniref:SAM-dependent methyltransferase n=1 Tax=Cronobacter condimenti 1330 TaxID=1073999 RepID=K8A1T8_9ENTR|nr:class I SAM-dependent methyltransferase [Cronobacter condimenti]ALB62527.1 SAM-dependent methyltransferase [Cronobacter condimenti 1330]CCJ73476.1 SAM-dependent methyltransferases [Cronobacter condimenti 1330]
MTKNTTEHGNWFAAGGRAYSRFRPEYPPELAAHLASIAPDNQKALDVGCGTGQLTRLLSAHFQAVTGVDPSEDQLRNAPETPGVRYMASPAESLPDDFHGFNLITAAQAAHWFRLDAFYKEVRRVASADAILALISYGVLSIDGAVGERFRQFYDDEIGPFWPPERQWVDSGYRDLFFPFAQIQAPALVIEAQWDLNALLGYVSTWSAVRQAQQKEQENIVTRFAADLHDLWGDPGQHKTMTWPVNMRIGRI